MTVAIHFAFIYPLLQSWRPTGSAGSPLYIAMEILMRIHWTLIALLAVTLSATAFAQEKKDESNEVKMKFDQVPAAVRETLTREAKGGKIDTVDKETRDGKTVYEADVKIDGKNWELLVSEDGKLLSKKEDNEEDEKDKKHDEVKVSMDQLPDAVKVTLMKEAGGGKIGEIAKETKDGKTVYEADVTIDGKEWELKIGEDGKLLNKKQEGEKHEKGDGKNKRDGDKD